MKKIKINLDNFDVKDVDFIVDNLKKGKVIVYPTDTVYGLGCLATNENGLKRINILKKRSTLKPFIILVNSIKMVQKYANINKKQVEYLNKIWPGPITVILKSKEILPLLVSAGQDSIAFRLPKCKFLITMLSRTKEPLISTSWNISGKPSINRIKVIKTCINSEQPDLAIDAGALHPTKPSQIIDIRDINNIKIIRS